MQEADTKEAIGTAGIPGDAQQSPPDPPRLNSYDC